MFSFLVLFTKKSVCCVCCVVLFVYCIGSSPVLPPGLISSHHGPEHQQRWPKELGRRSPFRSVRQRGPSEPQSVSLPAELSPEQRGQPEKPTREERMDAVITTMSGGLGGPYSGAPTVGECETGARVWRVIAKIIEY